MSSTTVFGINLYSEEQMRKMQEPISEGQKVLQDYIVRLDELISTWRWELDIALREVGVEHEIAQGIAYGDLGGYKHTKYQHPGYDRNVLYKNKFVHPSIRLRMSNGHLIPWGSNV